MRDLHKLILEAMRQKPTDFRFPEPFRHSDPEVKTWADKMQRVHDLEDHEHAYVMKHAASKYNLNDNLIKGNPDLARKIYFKAHLDADEHGAIW